MSALTISLILFPFFLLFGMPIAFTIGISGLAFFLFSPDLPINLVAQKSISMTQSFTMLAMPLFVFAGNLMNNTGMTKRLVRLADVLTGHMYGNLGQVSCVLSALMGGCSGSATADAAMEARLLGPEMVERGYTRGWAAAINGWSSLIVTTIPPSMTLILYGSTGEVSIGKLFTAGIIPGVIMTAALMIAVSVSAKSRNYVPSKSHRASFKEIFIAIKDSFWALMFPLFLIIFLRGGIMTASESGAFSAVYAIVIGKFVYKELTFESFKTAVRDSAKDVAAVSLILAFVGVFSYGIVYERVPYLVGNMLLAITSNKYVMVLLICTIILVLGMFLNATVIILMMTPIFLPVIKQIGLDPVHFGIIMCTCCSVGIMTPPVGAALFATSSIMECSPDDVAKEGIPFMIAIIICVAIMLFVPEVVMWLPNLLFG